MTRAVRRLDQAAMIATLLCPVFLLHARVVAAALIGIVAASFLCRSALERDWS